MQRRDFLRAIGLAFTVDETIPKDEIHFVHPDGRVDKLVNIGKSAKPRLADIRCCMTCRHGSQGHDPSSVSTYLTGVRDTPILPLFVACELVPLKPEPPSMTMRRPGDRIQDHAWRQAFQVCDFWQRRTE